MRKVIIVLIALLIAAPALFAQDALMKGAWDLGGGFSFTSASGDLYENADGDAQTVITFAPDLGYFLMDNLSLGVLLSFSSWSQGDAKSSNLMFGPRVAYYMAAMGPGNPYLHLSYIFGSSTSNSGASGAEDIKSSTSDLGLGVGYLIWLNDYVALDAKLGYSIDSWEPEDGDKVDGNSFGIMFGFKMFHF